MAVVRGSRVSLPDGTAAVAYEQVSDLNGPRWRVRMKGGEMSEYRTAIVHESAMSDVQPPPTFGVDDPVRIGPAGPFAIVTAVNGDLYTVAYTQVLPASGMEIPQTSQHTAADLVGAGGV